MRHQEAEFQTIPIHPSALRILLSEGPAFAANRYFKFQWQSLFICSEHHQTAQEKRKVFHYLTENQEYLEYR